MKVRIFRRRRGAMRVTRVRRIGDPTTPRLIAKVRPRWVPVP